MTGEESVIAGQGKAISRVPHVVGVVAKPRYTVLDQVLSVDMLQSFRRRWSVVSEAFWSCRFLLVTRGCEGTLYSCYVIEQQTHTPRLGSSRGELVERVVDFGFLVGANTLESGKAKVSRRKRR